MGTRLRARFLVLVLALGLSNAVAIASGPRAVGPGSVDRWDVVPEGCATFHWVPSSVGGEVELAIYALESRAVSDSEGDLDLVTSVSLPGGAAGWTLPLDQCLTRGQRHAWSVRERTSEGWSEWSQARLFEVSSTPSAREAREAALLLERAAARAEGTEGGSGERRLPQSSDGPSPAVTAESEHPIARAATKESSSERRPWRRSSRSPSGKAGIRGEQTDTTGERYGVHGVTNSGGGGSAGLIGESVATSGAVAGVVGRVASPDGTAGLLENPTGDPILRLLVYGVGLSFTLDGNGDVWAAGSLTAASYSGDGSGLSGVDAKLVDGQPASAYGGDIQSVIAGSGLTGGGTSGEVTLAVAERGVTSFHLAPNSVTASELAPNSVLTSKVIDDSLTSVDLADYAITRVELQDASISSPAVANGTLTVDDIDPSSIQRRVSGACGSDRSIRSIDANGNVVCEYDDFLDVGVSGQWEANATNGNNDYVTIPAGNNFCYLVYVRLRDIEDSDESASCRVSYGPNNDPPIWRLAATSNNDADAKCRMRCLTW